MIEEGLDPAWTERSRDLVAKSPVFDLWRSRRCSPGGREGEFWILEAPDWVTVVPILRDAAEGERFLMVRQFRHGAACVTTEFPAGLVEPGEDPAAAAARELAEETGWRAGRLELLGAIRPNPAFMTNRCSIYLAESLERAGTPAPDALEELEVREVPAAEALARAGTGEYVNSLVMAALLWYGQRRGHIG